MPPLDGIEEIKSLIKGQSDEIKGQVEKVTKAHEELDGVVKKINDDLETHGTEFAETKEAFQKQVEVVEKLETTLDELTEKLAKLPGVPGQGKAKSLGQICAESEVAKNYNGGHAVIAKYEGSLFDEQKDITSGGASAGDLIEPFIRPGIMQEPDRALVIRDLLTVLPISTNAVEWARENVFTNAAASQTAEGAAKAKSDITFTKESTAVETIAHWMALSRQVLADARALRAFVDRRLRYGLQFEEEQQLLNGDGLNGNLSGLIPNSTAYDSAGLGDAGDTPVDQLRKFVLQCALSSYPASAFVLHPQDWCSIELIKTNENAYLFSNPQTGAVPRLWGKRVVESLSMTQGDALGGSFNLAATLWDREQITIRVAEQHANFFIENMVAILAEERVALTVEHSLALINGTLVAFP